jgi:four helix bundle protein
VHKYRELKVWQRAMTLTVAIYRETRNWPQDERFGLINQIRRAATSIPLNIAEGAGNDSDKEFRRFLQIALRSTYEVMTTMEIACNLDFLSREYGDSLLEEADEIAAMIVGLMKSLGWRNRHTKRPHG